MHNKLRSAVISEDVPRLCVIVPCYDEEEMLPAFLAAVTPLLEQATDGQWAMVCVDDGSRDGTFEVIRRWHVRDSRISGIRLSRNFGHQAALAAGMAYARGEYIGIMDCDLQDPAQVLWELFRACVRDQLDVCFGIRGRRDAPWFLRLAYSVFYRIIRKAADHDWPRDAGDFCVMSARCQRALLALPEQSRMLRGLRSWVGFRQAGIVYDRPARARGASKYNLRKLAALALEGLISFSNIPLRLASVIGVGMGLFSILFGTLVLLNRLAPRFTMFGYWVGANPGTATLLVFLSFSMSVLFICLGIIGEYLLLLLQEIKRRPAAIVASIAGELEPYDSAYRLLDAATQPSLFSVTAR
ncbi:MAG TPA: glycosyltransferase family 2 protein [Bryobacteraceae bacterium]|nr:glycosyltransferase family 2 protein [Bryobacteraceae bacterium]